MKLSTKLKYHRFMRRFYFGICDAPGCKRTATHPIGSCKPCWHEFTRAFRRALFNVQCPYCGREFPKRGNGA